MRRQAESEGVIPGQESKEVAFEEKKCNRRKCHRSLKQIGIRGTWTSVQYRKHFQVHP